MAKRANPNKSVSELLEFAIRECPKNARNFERWLRLVTPAIAGRFFNVVPPVPADGPDRVPAYEEIPARLLCEVLDWSQKGKAYSPWIIEAVPELLTIIAYNREYRKAAVSVLKRAFDMHILSRAHVGVSQEWIDSLAVLDDLPFTNTRLAAYKDRGEKTFCGISIDDQPERVKVYAAQVRDATNVLARAMTTAGRETPQAVTAAKLYGDADSFYAQTLKKNANSGHVVSKAKVGWKHMQHHFPGLVDWPEPQKARTYRPDAETQVSREGLFGRAS